MSRGGQNAPLPYMSMGQGMTVANIIHLCGKNCSGSSVMLLDPVYTHTGNLLRYERKLVSLHIMLCDLMHGALIQNEVLCYRKNGKVIWKRLIAGQLPTSALL